MSKYYLSYRDGETTAEVEAETAGEAVDLFINGKAGNVKVNFDQLWPDMVLVMDEDGEDIDDWEINDK